MEAVIFIGIQAAGKSTFYKARFFNTHLRINLDMLRTRQRETIILQACLAAKQSFVVDNTNLSVNERAKYIQSSRENRFDVIGYYFRSNVIEALQRNAQRSGRERIPEKGIWAAAKKLQPPTYDEGFDRLYEVSIPQTANF